MGEEQFNERVRSLAKKCKSRHVKRMRLSAAARQAREAEKMKAMFGELIEKKLAPVVDGMGDLKLTLGQTISEVVKLKAEVHGLKSEQREKLDMQRQKLVAMSDDLSKLRAGLKLE